MMNGWLELDQIAAAHSDGFNPAFRNILQRNDGTPPAAHNVVDLAVVGAAPFARRALAFGRNSRRIIGNVVRYPVGNG